MERDIPGTPAVYFAKGQRRGTHLFNATGEFADQRTRGVAGISVVGDREHFVRRATVALRRT